MQAENMSPAELPSETNVGLEHEYACFHNEPATQVKDSELEEQVGISLLGRSPLHPITPGPSSPLAWSKVYGASSSCKAQNMPHPASRQDSPATSPTHMPGNLVAPSTPHKQAGYDQLCQYKEMCEDLKAKRDHFQENCERLEQENERLRAHHLRAGSAGDELMADHLTQQLQHLMQEKAKLQRDKEALESDNEHLVKLLDYARAMMEVDCERDEG
jgi:FtsZ-binding cell division protein ZapB